MVITSIILLVRKCVWIALWLFPTGFPMGNYKIAIVRLSVRPSGVISQRWLDECFWNRNMLFPSTPGWCPSLRNFNIVSIGRLTALFVKSYIPHSKKSLCGFGIHWEITGLLWLTTHMQCCNSSNALIGAVH